MNILENHLIKYVIFSVLSLSVISASAGDHILIPKFGVVDIKDNTTHLVDSNRFDFDDDNASSLGFSYLYKLDNGFAFGVDIFGYEKDIITTANNRGDANFGHVYVVAEKFFNNNGNTKPYIGLGLGYAGMGFDARINGNIASDNSDRAYGVSYQLLVGMEVDITESIGMMFEYKYFDIDINDDIGLRDIAFESDGSALFVGISIHI